MFYTENVFWHLDLLFWSLSPLLIFIYSIKWCARLFLALHCFYSLKLVQTYAEYVNMLWYVALSHLHMIP